MAKPTATQSAKHDATVNGPQVSDGALVTTAASQADPATGETTPPPNKAKITPVKKLTVNTCYGDIRVKDLPPLFIGTLEAPEPNPNPELKLCKFAGLANSTKTGTTQFGQWFAMLGEFAGMNCVTGDHFVSKVCLIPGAMGDALIDAVNNMNEKNAESTLRFSVEIFVKRSKRQPDEKYEYVVRPVIETALAAPAMDMLLLTE